jgi:hypothetical protein
MGLNLGVNMPMMGLLGDPKKSVSVILGKKDSGLPPQSHVEKVETDYSAAMNSAAAEIMSAIETKDVSRLAKALESFDQVCDSKEESGEDVHSFME